MYLYSGRLSNLLAGRPTLTSDPLQNQATLPYWNQTRLVLPLHPPILMLDAFDTQDFGAARQQGGRLLAPGVVLLGGLAPVPAGGLHAATLPRLVPNPLVAFVWAAVILLLLFVAGLGWARAFVDPGSPPEVVVGLAPAVGAGMLILGALPPALAGVGLGGVTGVAVFVVVTAAGWALAPAGPDGARSRERDPRESRQFDAFHSAGVPLAREEEAHWTRTDTKRLRRRLLRPTSPGGASGCRPSCWCPR